jgi:hypothetical protein
MVITDLLCMIFRYLVLNIPVQEVINIIDNFLHLRAISLISKNQILQWMTAVLSQNYVAFSYNMQGMVKNGNTFQYRNKTGCVGCTDRILTVSTVHYCFVCLCCVVPVSVRYRLCLVTVCMKLPQNRRLARFTKRTHCWCAFSWSICNQIGQLIGCIQSSSFQGYDGIHIMERHYQLRGLC